MRKSIVIGVLAAAAGFPAAAQAHVTVQPNTATAGGYTRLDVRVPTEREDASTSKLVVKLPDGFASASYEPVPGWSVKVATKKLKTPITTDDGQITEGVDTITWTAKSKQDAIPPGAFQDFGLSLKIPDKPGKLTFKALQTYSNGEVVRRIGGESSDTPAPVVTTTPAGASAESATPAPSPAATAAAATAAPAKQDDGSSNGLAIAALIVGALGLITGVAGLLAARRSRVAA
jgi:uncharacterized protein